jgi:hypothetical protein
MEYGRFEMIITYKENVTAEKTKILPKGYWIYDADYKREAMCIRENYVEIYTLLASAFYHSYHLVANVPIVLASINEILDNGLMVESNEFVSFVAKMTTDFSEKLNEVQP